MEKMNDIPAPLLQEVNQLLEKERTLMELKLLDQELESEKWKSKYDQLYETVVGGETPTNKTLEQIEKLGEVEDLEAIWEDAAQVTKHQHYPVTSLLLENLVGNLAKFNGIGLTKTVFSGLMKALFGSKSEHPEVDLLWVNHCDIDPESIETIEFILKSPRLRGLDISHNYLDDDVLFSFVEILNVS